MRRSIFLFVVLSACLYAATAHGEDKAALQARLDRVNKLTALDDPALKPWNMKLSFQLYDLAGKPTEQGTIEEWWAGPSTYKITVTSPSYTATTIANREGQFRTTGQAQAPYLIEVLERQMVHPMPHAGEVEGLTPQTMKVEGATGPSAPECIMLNKALRNVPYPSLGLFPTYCMVPGKDLLQVSYDYTSLMVARVAMGAFQQKVMPIDLKVSLNRVDAISSHLLGLKTMALADSDFAVPASGMTAVNTHIARRSYEDVLPTIVAHPEAGIPPGIDPRALSQPVEVDMIIGTDGNVHGLRLLATPDMQLAMRAMSSMIRWHYEIPKENGQPAEIVTAARLVFSNGLGRGLIGPK